MYEAFAQLYDELNGTTFYNQWYELISQFGQPQMKVLDLGCGSGTLLSLLNKDGYEVTGVDLSENMLVLAQEKLNNSSGPFDLYELDMSDFLAENESYDIIVSSCDSINYLEEASKVKAMFTHVETMLKPGGFFIFDVHSDFTFQERFQDWLYVDMQEELSVTWECETEDNFQFTHYLTFFQQKKQNEYIRFDEQHEQFYYTKAELEEYIGDTGLVIQEIKSDFASRFYDAGERTFFIVRKNK